MSAYIPDNSNGSTTAGPSRVYDTLLGRLGSVLENKTKSKKPKKVTVDSSEEKVAGVLTGFLKNKEKELKSKLDTKTKEKSELENKIKELVKKARTLEVTTGTLAQKYQDTITKNRSEVVDDYRKLITKIKLLDFIEKFEVDSEKRILFTTVPLSIQKKDWDTPKLAGRYQVRIDFKKGNISEGIQGINIDQHYQCYDHPNLNNAKFCYGNKLAVDIEQEYREQDLYELVIDLVDLLRSPNDKDGWTRWGYFFKGAKKRPKGYSFAKYDQEDASNGVSFSTTYDGMLQTMTSMASMGTIQYTGTATAAASRYYGANNFYPIQPTREDGRESITIHLLRLGFVDVRSAQYFTDRILHITRGATPSTIELRRVSTSTDSDAELFFVIRENYHHGLASLSLSMDSAPEPHYQDRVERIMVPANLLRPEGSAPALDEATVNQIEIQMQEERLRNEQLRNEAIAQAQQAQQNTVIIDELKDMLVSPEEEK